MNKILRKDQIISMLNTEHEDVDRKTIEKHNRKKFSNYSDMEFIDHFRKYFPNIELIRKNTFAI